MRPQSSTIGSQGGPALGFLMWLNFCRTQTVQQAKKHFHSCSLGFDSSRLPSRLQLYIMFFAPQPMHSEALSLEESVFEPFSSSISAWSNGTVRVPCPKMGCLLRWSGLRTRAAKHPQTGRVEFWKGRHRQRRVVRIGSARRDGSAKRDGRLSRGWCGHPKEPAIRRV